MKSHKKETSIFTSVCVLGCRVPLVVIIILTARVKHSLDNSFFTQAFFSKSRHCLAKPSVDVIFQELDHPLFSLLGFPSSTSKLDTWLKHTGRWLGFTWDDILSWPKDYWVIASLSIGINTTVFSSCEGPQPVLEWTNVNLFGCWLVLRSTFSLE